MNVKNGSLSIAKCLIEKGADVSLYNDFGETPLDVAVDVGFLIFIVYRTDLQFFFSFPRTRIKIQSKF